MTTNNVMMMHRWFEEVWNQGRFEAIDEMAEPDVIGHGQGQHGIDIGLTEFRPFVRTLRSAFPDIRVKIEDAFGEGDRVVVRWRASMTHTGQFLEIAPTGRQVSVTGITIARIVRGKIVEGWDNWDQLGMLVQLGAAPAVAFISKAGPARAIAS